MRKALICFVTLILCLSLSPYGKGQAVQTPSAGAYEDTTEVQNAKRQAKIQANIDTFYEYISTHPNKINLNRNQFARFETGIPGAVLYGAAFDGAGTLLLMEYTLSDASAGNSQSKQTVGLYLRGGADQQEGKYYFVNSSMEDSGNDKLEWSAAIHADPATFAVGNEGEIVNFKSTHPNIARYSDDTRKFMLDGVHTIMELFDKVLRESQLNLTLEDFGFEAYTVDASRESDIKAGKNAVEPAPLELTACKLATNSIGTPTIEPVFKNTGSKAVEAFDFYVRCYDAYGEIVKQYNNTYNVFAATYQANTIQPGGETQREWQWTMYGFDTVKRAEIAVIRYKLAGELAVTIPESQFVWMRCE